MIQYRAASCGGGRSSCPGAELTVETIHGIPLYGADLETADGIPERVAALKEIVAADGLPLVTVRNSGKTVWIELV